jgi:lysophospholipase L1-like esterase
MAGSSGAAGTGTATGGNAPPGYPAPTTDNRSKCMTVPMTGTVCPGGGPGPVCIECLFGGDTYTVPNVATAEGTAEAGNYVVTVQLGGAAAGQTFISAESNRGLLSSVSTAAGQSAEYSFVVNVRANEGQPVEANASAGYAGLDLFFSGTTAMPPQISAIGYALTSAATKPVMVYVASDSTVCDQTDSAFAGWGQMLPEFFAPPLGIANYADSGESSASFYGNGKMWGAIKAHWAPGDWVIIQFGHNDKMATDAQVETNLEKYVTDALAANVTPILVSPPARVGTWNGNVLASQASLHPASAMGAAAAKNVAYIDLTSLSTAWYNTLGSEAAALKFHANDSDATHTNLAGATKLASLVAGAIKTQNLGLAKYLRP